MTCPSCRVRLRIPLDAAHGWCPRCAAHLRVLEDNPTGAMFRDRHGLLHPIRSWEGYKRTTVEHRAAQRQASRESTAEQQIAAEWERDDAKHQKVERLQEQRERLAIQREGIRSHRETDMSADLTKLIRRVNKGTGELDLIPLDQAKRLTGIRHFHSDVVRGGHHYVPREYVLDELAEEAGYRGSAELERAVGKAQEYRARERVLDRQISDLDEKIRGAKGERKARQVAAKAKVTRMKTRAARKKAA